MAKLPRHRSTPVKSSLILLAMRLSGSQRQLVSIIRAQLESAAIKPDGPQ
jgi:ABC-type multidrug transport system fused ATPase/permease subunit